jgi:biotin carboxylase
MDTVVIISTRGFGAFRHDLLVEPEKVRFIGIYTRQDVRNVTDAERAFFDQIYSVPCARRDPTYAESSGIDIDAARDLLREIIRQFGTAGLTLCCYDEQNVSAAAALRTEFGLPGHTSADVLPYRDKCLMKSKLATTGLRVPTFNSLDAELFAADPGGCFERIVAEVGMPFVMKPMDSAAADGVYKIFSAADFDALARDRVLRRPYEYEEYIEGTMYSVNIMTRARQSIFAGVTEYLNNSTEVARGRVNADINLIDSDPRVGAMIEFAETALGALGRLDGASHLELFQTGDGELVFLEVGARLKGLAGVAAMQQNYGIALVNLALEIEAGLKSHPWDRGQVSCFDAVVPKRPGVIEELMPPVLDSEFEMKWTVQPGDEVSQSASLSDNGGTFLVWNNDFEVLYADFKRLATYNPIRYRD